MKVIYLVNLQDPKYGFCKDLESSLKKKHQVEVINDRDFKIEEFVDKCNKADLLLYHQGGIWMTNEMDYTMSLERLKQMLQMVKCKKVCWFVEKGWFLNNETLEQTIPLNDLTFLNDETWFRRHKFDKEKVFPLHTACRERVKGEYNEKYKCDIAFYGQVLAYRQPFIDYLKDKYGRKFKVWNFLFGKDLADLIASAKIIFSPIQPNDEFYWDNRIYEVLNQGGVLIYPKLYGLEEEGFEAGKHYLGYKDIKLAVDMMDEYLKDDKKLKEISQQGQKFVKKFTYDARLSEIFKRL